MLAAMGSVASTSTEVERREIPPRRSTGRFASKRPIVEGGDRRFQVQAAPNRRGHDRIPIRRDRRAQLADAGIVGPARPSHKDGASHHEHVSTVERPGRDDLHDRAMPATRQLGDVARFPNVSKAAPGRVMTAISSKTMAMSSMNTESGMSAPAGSRLTVQPSRSSARSYSAC